MFGHRETFTLTDPLKMKKGDFVALTIPTWAPSFASTSAPGRTSGAPAASTVRATAPTTIKTGKPQQKVGSEREYGCDYRGARLLYWAYYTPR